MNYELALRFHLGVISWPEAVSFWEPTFYYLLLTFDRILFALVPRS